MERKGQAAMEFLMTYGWAILAAIIAIAVLAYFGVFNPGRYMSNICTITAPLSCDEYSLTTTGITIVVRNGLGEEMTISSVTVGDCDPDTTGWTVADGGTAQIGPISTGCTGLSAGNKFKGDITIVYRKTGGTIDQQTTGSISGRVS